jgi:demethylmenaquinone methyltransferase / 2-methoxy-6-polyprenyl-1,4-benzoquinol methylase
MYHSARYALANRWDAGHLRAVRRHLDLQPGDRVLEVGSGRGHLVQHLRADGIDAVGVDVNPMAVEHGVTDHLHVMDATALEFPDAHFDALVSMHMIEHVPDLDVALGEMARVVRPGGSLLLVYPAEPIQGMWAIPTSLILHGTPWRARDVHCHKITPRRLSSRLEHLPLQIVDDCFQLLKSPQFTSVLERTA